METNKQKIQRLGNSICKKLNILFDVDDFEFARYDNGANFSSTKTNELYTCFYFDNEKIEFVCNYWALRKYATMINYIKEM